MPAIFKYKSNIKKFIGDINRWELRNRRDAGAVVRKEIKKKAKMMSHSGNLAKGVYQYDTPEYTHVGLRRPAYHAYLIEFGHLARDGSKVKAYPIVYPTFAEKAEQVGAILSRAVPE